MYRLREIKTLFHMCIAMPVVSAEIHSPRSEGDHSKSVWHKMCYKKDKTHQHHQSRRYSWEHSRHRRRLRPTWSRGWQSFLSPLQPLLSFTDLMATDRANRKNRSFARRARKFRKQQPSLSENAISIWFPYL